MAPLPNTLAGLHQLRETPSRADGIPPELEEELRVYGCQLIQQAGILLRLPQVAMATAQVLYQRFWFVSSMKHFSIRDVCRGALFLATKLEEHIVHVRDLINVLDYLIQRALHLSKHSPGPRLLELHGLVDIGDVGAMRTQLRSDVLPASPSRGPDRHPIKENHRSLSKQAPPFRYTPPPYFSQDFYDAKDALVVAEMQILKRLGFHVQVNLPFATLVNYLKLLDLTDPDAGVPTGEQTADGVGQPGAPRRSFAQRAWSALNDALQTPLYCQFPPHVLACGAIYFTALSTRPMPLALPMRPKPWWVLFDVEREEELRIIAASLFRLYDDSGWEVAAQASTTEETRGLGAMGLASRVRDEWGGLVELLDRKAVRQWTERAQESRRRRGDR